MLPQIRIPAGEPAEIEPWTVEFSTSRVAPRGTEMPPVIVAFSTHVVPGPATNEECVPVITVVHPTGTEVAVVEELPRSGRRRRRRR